MNKNMTWKELSEHISNMPAERMLDNVSFKDEEGDFVVVNSFDTVVADSEESGTLDVGHRYISYRPKSPVKLCMSSGAPLSIEALSAKTFRFCYPDADGLIVVGTPDTHKVMDIMYLRGLKGSDLNDTVIVVNTEGDAWYFFNHDMEYIGCGIDAIRSLANHLSDADEESIEVYVHIMSRFIHLHFSING